MNMPSAGVLLISAMIATSAMGTVTTSVVDVPVQGATQRFLYLRSDAPAANIVALPDGDGILGIQDDGTMSTLTALCNPVARNRQAFAGHGFAVGLVDAASDGSAYDFNHVLEVIRYMQARDNVPTWIIGGWESTPAIWNLAINLPSDMPVGVIFFSPALPTPSQVALIKRPTLVVYHALDSRQFGSQTFAALTSAPVREVVSLIGGSNSGCGYHLFNGLDAEFLAATTGFIDRYNSATGGGSPQTAVAVEYYYDVWNFYFETSFPDEIAALDGGAFGGAWKRTGETFKVWSQATGSASATCRFFSTAFAPRSSHFYTPFPSECALVQMDPALHAAWQFENIAFYIQLADANGFCPAGTIPLYRLYNDGMGGAPNHRYTTSVTVFNQMAAAGWLFEGDGNTKVFACVPQ
ncbi:MAG TPA: hypothetical protein VGR65_07160 [Casimicrobiaceae bacterium]|nr:hypothetical protein [Casimicrobiaceae bacterium]